MSDARTAMEMASELCTEVNRLRDDLREALDVLQQMVIYDAGIDEYLRAQTILKKHGRPTEL